MSNSNTRTNVNVQDFDINNGIVSAFRYANKCYAYFFHISYLECCKYVGVRPAGLQIKKTPFIQFQTDEFFCSWMDTINSAEVDLLDTLLLGLSDKLWSIEKEFWDMIGAMRRRMTDNFDDMIEWWVKLTCYLEKEETKICNQKRKKIRKLLGRDEDKKNIALRRFEEHLENFDFKLVLSQYAQSLSPDIFNLINLVSLNNTTQLENRESEAKNSNTNFNLLDEDSKFAKEKEGRLEGVFVCDNILNLSKRELNTAEISILSKGMKFVPTPRYVDQAALKTDLEAFGRKLRLAWHFRNNEGNPFEVNPFRKRTNFNPKNKDVAIEMYLSKLEEEILNINTKIKHHNVTKEERNAIESLRNDTSIIIKEADKGSGIVIWDREDYLKEAESQLGDRNVYEKLKGDSVSPLIKVIKSALSKIQKRGDISNETLDYFLTKDPKLGRFYLLPKIHKRLHNVPGRPVISNSSFFTENISAFLDFHLQPLAREVKSYIKDTNDFLRKLSDLPPLKKDVLLCTVDVVGLYPNIPHKDGLEALKKVLESRKNKTVSTESLLELTKLVLENNVFEHNGETFRQKQGTAIGTKMAPQYAILFMAYLEERLLGSCTLKPLLWWRYIDDIFFIWEHGEESLKSFLEHINSAHPTIKFTAEFSKEKVNFLDVQITRKQDKLVTDLYVKSTDTHQYLDYSSCHPHHCKNSIPYSQALRLNRICSEASSFDKRCNELESWLQKRGYDDRLIRSKVLSARKFNRNELLNREKEGKKKKITLNISYHPAYQGLNRILRKIHVILAFDKEHEKVFRDMPIVGFRRGKSLKDMLVRAKVPPLIRENGNSEPCSGKRCRICPFIENSTTFAGMDGTNYDIRQPKLNCNSSNVVYLLSCKACGIQYVGSCTTKFRLRFNNYKSCNRKHFDQTVPQQNLHNHFDKPGHNGIADFTFTLIDQAENEKCLRKREKFWQYKLNTFVPRGLNDHEVVLPT